MGCLKYGEEFSSQREAENYTDIFAVAVMKDNNQCTNVLQHTPYVYMHICSIGINFHTIVLPHEKYEN